MYKIFMPAIATLCHLKIQESHFVFGLGAHRIILFHCIINIIINCPQIILPSQPMCVVRLTYDICFSSNAYWPKLAFEVEACKSQSFLLMWCAFKKSSITHTDAFL